MAVRLPSTGGASVQSSVLPAYHTLLLTTPLTAAQWEALPEGELFQQFLLTACVLNEHDRCELRALNRALRTFLAANQAPNTVRRNYLRPWLKQQLLQHGYSLHPTEGATLVEGLGLRSAPLSRFEMLASFPHARAAARRRVLHRAPPQWSYWDEHQTILAFFQETCLQDAQTRVALRVLKRAFASWKQEKLPSIPKGCRGAFRSFRKGQLVVVAQDLGYRLIRPDNIPFLKGLQLAPAWVAAHPGVLAPPLS